MSPVLFIVTNTMMSEWLKPPLQYLAITKIVKVTKNYNLLKLTLALKSTFKNKCLKCDLSSHKRTNRQLQNEK